MSQSNVELSDILNDIENYKYSKYGVSLQFIETAILALFQSQQHQLLQGLLEELPEMTLRDVINAEMFPSPEEHKKMVWILETYRNGVKSVIQNKLEGLS